MSEIVRKHTLNRHREEAAYDIRERVLSYQDRIEVGKLITVIDEGIEFIDKSLHQDLAKYTLGILDSVGLEYCNGCDQYVTREERKIDEFGEEMCRRCHDKEQS